MVLHNWEKDKVLESKLQEDTIALIKKKFGENAWVFKTRDECRVGIPDILLCFYGHFVAIELKRRRGWTNKKGYNPETFSDRDVTPMQKYNIGAINRAGGTAFVGRTTTEIIERLNKVKESLRFL